MCICTGYTLRDLTFSLSNYMRNSLEKKVTSLGWTATSRLLEHPLLVIQMNLSCSTPRSAQFDGLPKEAEP